MMALLAAMHLACGRTELPRELSPPSTDEDLQPPSPDDDPPLPLPDDDPPPADTDEDLPLAPSTATVLDSGGFPYAIAADDTAVYWQDFNDGSVHTIPLSGDPPQTLAPSRGAMTPVYGMVAAGDGVYQCDNQRGVIERIPLTGGSPVTVVSVPCSSLATDGVYVYWSNGGVLTEPVVSRLLVGSSGTSEPVGPVGTGSGILTLGGGWLYFTDWAAGTVSRLAVTGGTPEIIATTEASGPWGLAADDTYLYFADHHAGYGGIMRVPLAGGTPESMVSGQDGAHGVVIDNGVIYWTNDLGGTVMKLAPGGLPVTLATAEDEPKFLVVTPNAVYWTSRGGTVSWVAK